MACPYEEQMQAQRGDDSPRLPASGLQKKDPDAGARIRMGFGEVVVAVSSVDVQDHGHSVGLVVPVGDGDRDAGVEAGGG